MTWPLSRPIAACALCLLAGTAPGAPGAAEEAQLDPLAALGYEVTGGAAPGYVVDALCAQCHGDIAESYTEVGMASSFYRPAAKRFIEDFEDSRFVHEASGRHYEMLRSGDGLLFRRWQEGPDGEPVNLFERNVDWIMGSGNHARVYLYRTPHGELYQLPTAWYTQERAWGMAPGFDRPDHLGVTRPVRRECMFCHNAYPDVPDGSDTYGEPHLFPAELPQGTGCQRCHGPGAEHVRRILSPDGTLERAREAIVNPGRLEPERRDDVCYQCHMQPSVAIPGVRRFGRADYSFRPGQDLAAYRVEIDVVEEGREREDRFEINHHPYRLEQSTCFRASEGALSCLTCHDPHRKVPEEERTAHYRAACLGCHDVDACQLDGMTEASGNAVPQPLRTVDPGDCVTCHMPERRTEDVVHVTMTDHRIRRNPVDPTELLASREERDPEIADVILADEARAPEGVLGQIYRALAVLRTGTSPQNAIEFLDRALDHNPPGALVPHLDLAKAQIDRHRWTEAEATLRRVLDRAPQNLRAREWLGLALAGQGNYPAAEAVLLGVLDAERDRPEARFNLGLILLGRGRPESALPHLRRATELRPNLAAAWLHTGNALLRLDRPAEAEEALRRSLAIDPTEPRGYVALAEALRTRGAEAEARQTLQHGLQADDDPAPIRAPLQSSDAPP